MKDHAEVAKKIVEEILKDLKDRHGVGDALDEVDDDVQQEIEEELIGITQNILLDSE